MPLDLNKLSIRLDPTLKRLDATRERIKGWTKKGLLRGSTPGRGGVRIWHHSRILDAALLNALVDRGLQPASWDLTPAFYVLRDAAEAWAAGDMRTRWMQLTLQPPLPEHPGTRGWAIATPLIVAPGQQQPELLWSSGVDAAIVVNLTAILKRLNWEPKDQAAIEADNKRRNL